MDTSPARAIEGGFLDDEAQAPRLPARAGATFLIWLFE
jgi:hypothetical protein